MREGSDTRIEKSASERWYLSFSNIVDTVCNEEGICVQVGIFEGNTLQRKIAASDGERGDTVQTFRVAQAIGGGAFLPRDVKEKLIAGQMNPKIQGIDFNLKGARGVDDMDARFYVDVPVGSKGDEALSTLQQSIIESLMRDPLLLHEDLMREVREEFGIEMKVPLFTEEEMGRFKSEVMGVVNTMPSAPEETNDNKKLLAGCTGAKRVFILHKLTLPNELFTRLIMSPTVFYVDQHARKRIGEKGPDSVTYDDERGIAIVRNVALSRDI